MSADRPTFDPQGITARHGYVCALCGRPGNAEQGNVAGREEFGWYHEGCETVVIPLDMLDRFVWALESIVACETGDDGVSIDRANGWLDRARAIRDDADARLHRA